VLLLDASVWIAAIDPDDPFHAPARTLVLSLEHSLGALDLTLYEVSNVVGVVKDRRELAGRICRAIVKRSESNFVRVSPTLAEQALKIAAEHRLTAYDAAYAAAANEHGWTLVSADIKDLVKPGLALAPDDPRVLNQKREPRTGPGRSADGLSAAEVTADPVTEPPS
jgi:predicted nucleic acid-binding protein